MFKAWAAFGLLPLAVLLLLGRVAAVWRLPVEFGDLHRRLALTAELPWLALAGLGGGLLGTAIRLALLRWRGQEVMLGDSRRLRPQGQSERGHAAALALTAGITEELFFRLLLPLLCAMLFGAAWFGFVAATLLFAWAHRYQGWTGVAASGAAGALAAWLYLASGQLWLAIAAHVLIDLNGLLLAPALARRFGRRD